LLPPTILGLAPQVNDPTENDLVPLNLQDYIYPEAINLQIVSRNGEIEIIRSDDFPATNQHPTVPFIAGAREEVPSFSPSQIKVLEKYRPWAMKVSVGDQTFCCKLSIALREPFIREYEILQQISDADFQNAISVPRLSGLVMVEEGVVGVLMDFIETNQPDLTFDLTEGISLTRSQRFIKLGLGVSAPG
jgi:hypothetical protein